MIPLQVLVIAVALIAFNQDWHVEEERPIGAGEDYGAAAARRGRRRSRPERRRAEAGAVPEVGIEPTRAFAHGLLRAACLPFHHSGLRKR